MTKLFWCPTCSTRTNHKRTGEIWTCRVCGAQMLDADAQPFIAAEDANLGQHIADLFHRERLIMPKQPLDKRK